MHVFSAIKESWTLTGGEILKKVDLVQNSRFGLVAVYLFGEPSSLSNREGGWKKDSLLDRWSWVSRMLNVKKFKSFKSLPCEGSYN